MGAHITVSLEVRRPTQSSRRRGFLGNRRGQTAENRFAWICNRFQLPVTICRVIKASREEDQNGSDFFAETVEGFRISIDVKASDETLMYFLKRLSRRRRLRKRANVIHLVVNQKYSDEEIFERFVSAVETERRVLLAFAKNAAAR